MATRKKVLWVINIYMDSIVTVTCTRDKWSMILQSHSLEMFVEQPCTHYVIINDEKTSMDEWKELLCPFYKTHTLVLVTRDSHPKIYPNADIVGWHSQQLLKFSARALIEEERYLILDTKNIFIKPTNLNVFEYEGCGSRINVSDNWMQYWMPWIDYVSITLNQRIPNKVWVPVTPFVVDKTTLSALFNTCDFESMIVEARDNSITVSEFLLYAFFAGVDHPNIPSYGGGYQGGNLRQTLDHLNEVRTFSLSRSDLQNIKKRRIIESILIYVGLEPSIVGNAVNRTTT